MCTAWSPKYTAIRPLLASMTWATIGPFAPLPPEGSVGTIGCAVHADAVPPRPGPTAATVPAAAAAIEASLMNRRRVILAMSAPCGGGSEERDADDRPGEVEARARTAE